MAKNIDHVLHMKSSVVLQNEGVSSPKLPNPSDILEGEIAINFAEGYETLSIKNNSGDVVTFSSDNNFYDKNFIDEKLGSAFTGANSAMTVTKAFADNELVVAAALNDLNTNKLDVSAYTPTDLSNYYTKQETSGATEISTALGNKTNTATTSALSAKTITVVSSSNNSISSTTASTGDGTVAVDIVTDASKIKMSGFTADTSGLTAVTENTSVSSAIKEVETAIINDERAISAALNVLNNTKLDASAYTPSAELWVAGSGEYSAVLKGSAGTAEGDSAVSEGGTAYGDFSHAEGADTTASGMCSHAEGRDTTAKGNYSHAEGNGAEASGESSHAEGFGTYAKGRYSHTEGYYTVTNNNSEHASGQYNISSSGSSTFGDSGNTLFSVGNGTGRRSKHNAFEIRQNGDIYIVSGGTDILLQDHIGGVVVDQVIDSGTSASTNAVSTSAVYSAMVDNELAWASSYVTLSGAISSHTANTNIHLTSSEKSQLHTHTNKTYLDGITGTVGTMAYQNANSYSSATEVNTALGNKLDITAYTPLVSVTYSDLVGLKTSSALVPGTLYRITDYQCTTAQDNTSAATHNFDIIVTATDVNVLSENAKAIKHDGDTYFSASTLDAWELKYSLENDTDRFQWADDTNGKGVIWWMKDEWNNECWYDFKNIMFKRYKIDDSTIDDLIGLYSIDGATNITADTSTTYYCYTFTMIDTSNNMPHDVSVEQDVYYSDEGYCYKTKNNIFKPYYDVNYDLDPIPYLMILPNNVFITDTDICAIEGTYGEFYGFYDNTFGNGCGSNTFGNYCYYNTFGNNCRYNTFGNGCGSNTFGNDCYYNTFGNYFQNNTFGNNCGSNTFGNSCGSNTFGNSCGSNTFGNGCGSNTFGNNNYRNTFGNDCYYNTFGNSCGSNTFGNDCYYNTFGNSCYSNTFGNYFQNNTFGNYCIKINFQKDYIYYCIIENGNQYINITSTQTTSSSNVIRNFTVSQGVNNSTTVKTISHNTVNDTFKTTYQNSSSTVVNI